MTQSKPVPVDNFLIALQHRRDGRLMEELSRRLAEVIEGAMIAPGKTAKLTLELNVKNLGNRVAINDRVKTSIPQPPDMDSLFYVDEHYRLMRRDPRQREITFRDIEEDDTEPREASND